jgi:hypothetical protein
MLPGFLSSGEARAMHRALLLAVLAAGCGGETTDRVKSENKDAPVEVTANELVNAFRADPVRAQERYGGRTIRLAGEVDATNYHPDIPIFMVALKARDPAAGVLCYFPGEKTPELAALKRSQVVVLEGTYSSHHDADPGVLSLNDCRLIGIRSP